MNKELLHLLIKITLLLHLLFALLVLMVWLLWVQYSTNGVYGFWLGVLSIAAGSACYRWGRKKYVQTR